MVKIFEVIQYLEEIAPLGLQESYDNAGLITGDVNWDVKGVVCALDVTEDIVDEAVLSGSNLIVAHHPIIFTGLRQLVGADYIQRTIIKAIKNDIAIYAIHTNLDNVLTNGVNDTIAGRLGLIDRKILAPKFPDKPHIGAGIIGDLKEGMEGVAFLEFLKMSMKTGTIKHTKILDKTIKRVAVCGGSGRFLLSTAMDQGADVFVSSDFKYHEYFDANGEILIADIGHYESEQFTIGLLHKIISEKFLKFATRLTEINTNPVHYF